MESSEPLTQFRPRLNDVDEEVKGWMYLKIRPVTYPLAASHGANQLGKFSLVICLESPDDYCAGSGTKQQRNNFNFGGVINPKR